MKTEMPENIDKHNLDLFLPIVGETSAACLVKGLFILINDEDVPFSDYPNELLIFLTFFVDLRFASDSPYIIKSGKCFHDCDGIQTCSKEEEMAKYKRQIPKVFNESIYGPECALELGQKREELETSGLLSRFIDEDAFLECIGYRSRFVYTIHSITDLLLLILCF